MEPTRDDVAAPAPTPRSRLRDWWRWVGVVFLIGSLPMIVVAVRRRRWMWAALVTLVTAGEWVCIILAGAQQQRNRLDGQHTQDVPSVLFVLLWVGSIMLVWAFPSERGPTSPERRRQARAARNALWPQATERARELTARYGLSAYVASLGAALLLGLGLRAAGVHIGLGVGVMVIDALLLASLLPLIRSRRLGRRDLGLRGTRPGAGAGLAVAALVVYLGLAAVWSLLVIHPATASQSFAKQLGIADHPGALAVVIDVFALALCAPVCEEIFFRGLLFRSLRNRLPLWAAALIAGSLFGLAHIGGYPLDTIPVKMLFGVLMCLLYERTGSLLPCIATHSFVDGSSADALFAGNLDIALGLTALVLISIGLRSVIRASREVRRGTPVAVAEPGAPWPPYRRAD